MPNRELLLNLPRLTMPQLVNMLREQDPNHTAVTAETTAQKRLRALHIEGTVIHGIVCYSLAECRQVVSFKGAR